MPPSLSLGKRFVIANQPSCIQQALPNVVPRLFTNHGLAPPAIYSDNCMRSLQSRTAFTRWPFFPDTTNTIADTEINAHQRLPHSYKCPKVLGFTLSGCKKCGESALYGG